MLASGLSLDRTFTVTAKATASPGLPATWSRSTASPPTDTKVYHAMGLAAFWTQPLTSVIELRRATTRTAD